MPTTELGSNSDFLRFKLDIDFIIVYAPCF